MAARGKTTQLKNMYVADFETTDSTSPYKVDKSTGQMIYNQRVWLAGFKNLETMESTVFTTLDDFMAAILSRGENTNTEYGFHNISFDGSYIVPWLLKNNYQITQDKPQAGEFSVLVDNRNAWYTITIQVTKRRRVRLWDTVKLFPRQLEYLHEVYSTPTKKIIEPQEFYTKERPEDYVPDADDLKYFENDLQVPAETLRKHIEIYGLRFKKTQASQSFYNFEQSFKAWKWRFPALTDRQDATIRPAYWGGISHVVKSKAGRTLENVKVYDINSSYPHKAAESPLPYGNMVAEYGEGKHPDMSKFWVAEALVEFKLKDYKLPCIPSKSITEGRPLEIDKWVDDSKGVVRMSFSSIDYYTIQGSYDFKVVRWVWSMHWAQKVQREVAKFVYKNNKNKVKYSDMARQATDPEQKAQYKTVANRAKIDNNSFYGKFGEDVVKEGKTPYLEDVDGVEEVVWHVDRKEVQSEGKRKYLPVAIAITAWGRRQLVEMANLLGEHFIYCDTDSVHYLAAGHYKIEQAEKAGIFEVHPTKLGAWDFEGDYSRGRFLRAKCYMEENAETGETEATVAGLPADPHTGAFSKQRSSLTWDNFHIGHIVPPEEANKLRSVRTSTGIKLLPVGFEITRKESLNTAPSLEKQLQQEWEQIQKAHDPVKQIVEREGYIQVQRPGDMYYTEYRQFSRSVIRKYFRKEGLPLDVVADMLHMYPKDLIDLLDNA